MANAYLAGLQDRDGPIGRYRLAVGRRPDLYASLDAALIRVIMGENFQETPSAADRRDWVEHINSYARRPYDQGGDGSYEDTYGHFPLHANGMVIGALGPLGDASPIRSASTRISHPGQGGGPARRARLEQSMARIPPLLGRPAPLQLQPGLHVGLAGHGLRLARQGDR